MRRRLVFGALLIVFVGAVLGGAVLRDEIAGAATAAAQSVVVTNTSEQAVPVHEEGTATVTPRVATKHTSFIVESFGSPGCPECSENFPAIRASLIIIESDRDDTIHLTLTNGDDVVMRFFSLQPGEHLVLPLTQLVRVDGAEINTCFGSQCFAEITVVGS